MPSFTEGKYPGEFMASEANGERSRDLMTLISGQNLVAGTILGIIGAGAAVAAAVAGNTGNGTSSAVTEGAGAVPGIYRLIAIAPTKFSVEDPNGHEVGVATTGVAFTGGGLTFTLTAGGVAFVPGDSFTITVAAGSGKATQVSLTAADGSQVAAKILYGNVNASASDMPATVISRDCEVNGAELTYPAGANGSQIAAINAQLAAQGILVRAGSV